MLWAVGRAAAKTDGLPTALLDDEGVVQETPTLQNPLYPNIFAMGDVATDSLRSSARKRPDRRSPTTPAPIYRAPGRGRTTRHPDGGLVLDSQTDGLQTFVPTGGRSGSSRGRSSRVLWPVIARRGSYHGVRPKR
ncbi:hypothetical protein [Gordonia oryzae]|uniref:hypothetical protein n=1 Tax=Gordonia oryzae TaxID=2487349 RepID=UPI001FE807F7|nr:hypothetical protein [Gordonia oryzae]